MSASRIHFSGSDSVFDIGNNFPRLQGDDDYKVWSFRMKLCLEVEGLFAYVNGDHPKPPEDAPLSTIKQWERSDQKAMCMIIHACSEKVICLIFDTKTSKETWDALADRYKPNEMIETIVATRELANSRWDESQDAQDHFRKMRVLRSRLYLGNDAKAKAMLWMAAVVNSLPSSLNGIIYTPTLFSLSGSSSQEIEKFTEDLINRVVTWDAFQKVRHAQRGGSPNQNVSRVDKSNMKCKSCHRKGHLEKECRKREADWRGGY